ncbi:hypothetical protein [Vibrio sp. Evd11]|uniref:hypothetical protein n=1 Tax=Vibrio sp. Evd11 TaxID=1207404 RepID=UPI000EFD20F5|nr:hypothetical protein [Vibrio sp. Evd11]
MMKGKELTFMLEVPVNQIVDEDQIVSDFTSKFIALFGGESDTINAVSRAIEKAPDWKNEADQVYVAMPINRFVSEQYTIACKYAFKNLAHDVADTLHIEVGFKFNKNP